MNFTLPRLFRNPTISNFFPFPLGLRNSGVRLYSHFSGTVISLINIGNVINITVLKVNNVVNGNRLVLVGSSRLQLGNQEK